MSMNLLDLLFPKRCLGCGMIGAYFCDRCTSTIRIIDVRETICPVCERSAIGGGTHPRCHTRYAIDGLTSFFHYDGVIRKAIKALKYRYVSDLAQELISLISPLVLSHVRKYINAPAGSVLFVPVPLYPSRLRWRGFNQAELLGRLLAERLNIPVDRRVLKRVRKTVPQVEVRERNKRLKNMEGVFALSHEQRVEYSSFDKFTLKRRNVKSKDDGINIVLFDDVFTTGATLRSAAAVLKRGGVKSVWGVTMAR